MEPEFFTTADGARLCFALHGAVGAPRLLYVQGSMQDMRRSAAFLNSLSRRFRVLVYDHRGMGRSTMDTDPTHYSMAGYAADADALLAHVGWNRCHVLGVSFGGMVAQEIALRYPARLAAGGGDGGGGGGPRALLLACTSAGGEAGASVPLHEYARLSDFAFFRTFFAKADTSFQSGLGRLVPMTLGVAGALLPAARHLDAGVREVFWGTCRHLQFGARAQHDTGGRLAALAAAAAAAAAQAGPARAMFRALVLGGDRDEVAPEANVRALAELIPGAELRFFAGGHGFMASNPEVVPAVSDWVLGQGPGGAMQPLPPPPTSTIVRVSQSVAVALVAVWAARALRARL